MNLIGICPEKIDSIECCEREKEPARFAEPFWFHAQNKHYYTCIERENGSESDDELEVTVLSGKKSLFQQDHQVMGEWHIHAPNSFLRNLMMYSIMYFALFYMRVSTMAKK